MAKDFKQQPNSSDKIARRKFIGVTAATAGAMLIKPALVRGTEANSAKADSFADYGRKSGRPGD